MPPLNRGVKDSTFPSNMGMGWQFYEATSEKSSVIYRRSGEEKPGAPSRHRVVYRLSEQDYFMLLAMVSTLWRKAF
jgi:hypothetical protein